MLKAMNQMNQNEQCMHYSIFRRSNGHEVPAYWYTMHMRLDSQQPDACGDVLVARLTTKEAFNATCKLYGFEPLLDQ